MAQGESKSIDLEDTFFHSHHPSKQYILKLSSLGLSINRVQRTSHDKPLSTYISINDLYGCLCAKPSKNTNICCLTFYSYTIKRPHATGGMFSRAHEFHRKQHTFVYRKHEDYEANLAEVVRWQQHVSNAIYFWRNLPADIAPTKHDKRALVLVNPVGGAGKAYRLVMEYAVGAWSEANFQYHIMLTDYAGHAREYVSTLDLNEWSGIIAASGDGLVYEIINGLFSRKDWQEALKMPVGHIPGGSGNAFITNIFREYKQPIAKSAEKFVVQSAILTATHQVVPFDLAVVDTCNGQRVFSFLSVTWGIIADIDFESEKYRYLGEARFTVEAMKRVVLPRIYHGYIDYLPYDPTDGAVHLDQLTSDVTTEHLHQHLLPLSEPIQTNTETSKWRRIEGPFISVVVTLKAAISKDAIATPSSTLADGYLTLQVIRNATRMQMARVLMALSDGSHFHYNFIERILIRAFRIVPAETEGNIMVDGERVSFGPIQGEVLPSFGRCMGKLPRDYQTQ